jgi:hypothetical protein
LTIKLTLHVTLALACRESFSRADNSPFHNSLSRTNLRNKSRRNSHRLASKRAASRLCQLLQLSKSFGSGYRPERSAPGGTSDKLSNRNKKPGVERRANPPANI